MGFEVSFEGRMEGGDWCSDKRVVSSRHKHSKSSDPERDIGGEDHVGFSRRDAAFIHKKPISVNRAEAAAFLKKKPVKDDGVQSTLRREILQLEDRLQDQFFTRRALEKALGYGACTFDAASENMMPKPTKELIREISVLELEVMYLERYLLSLYRKAYNKQAPMVSPRKEKVTHCFFQPELPLTEMLKGFPCEDCRTPALKLKPHALEDYSTSRRGTRQEKFTDPLQKSKGNLSCKLIGNACPETLNGSAVYRSRSELSQRAVSSAMASLYDTDFTGISANLAEPGGVHRSQSALSEQAVCSALLASLDECVDDSMLLCRSEPLSFEEGQSTASQVVSLAEFLGTRIADHVPETPNRISEGMIRCMGSIYCKLREPPLVHPGASSSTTSSFSSTSAVSPQYVGDTWSPVCKKENPYDTRLENPFRLQGLKELSGPYNALVEVASISTDAHRLHDVEALRKTFRSLLQRLEKVDPRKMKHEERLAFWINVHNALVMHAYVEYGTSQNFLKRAAILQKVSCKVGGRMINIHAIRSCILGHRMQYPGQWMRSLLSPRLKLKRRDYWQAYAIERPEPLLHFALCSGSHSDPVVRIYSPKRIYKMLETAKEEYIRATICIRKEEKIFLPKTLESYARESSLTPSETMDIVQRYLPETLRIAIRRFPIGRAHKFIEWVPHNFDFRYLLLRELNCPMLD